MGIRKSFLVLLLEGVGVIVVAIGFVVFAGVFTVFFVMFFDYFSEGVMGHFFDSF